MQKTNTAHLPLPKIKATSRQKSYGTYLYLKINTFYFRYAFTAFQKETFGKSEIRISLRTGFLSEAKKKARTLRSTLEVLLMSEEAKDIEDLKLKLADSLEKLLATCPNKRELSIQEIKMRLHNYLQVMIMEADDELYRPEGANVYDERVNFLPTDPQYWLEFANKILMFPLGSTEKLLERDYPVAIIRLLRGRCFAINEITTLSIPKILNEYRKIDITFNTIMLARERGDFAYERNFIDITPQAYCVPQKKQEIPENEQLMLLSEFMEKYIQTKISDKHWKEHSLPDHRNRLKTLIDMLGDVAIQHITREDFRKFRDTFSKLPPNYKKNAKYKDKSIAQILEMSPIKTYSIKTLNVTIEAIASMFEWGVREGYLDKNNAKSLQIKDERQDIELKEAFTADDIKKIFFADNFTTDKIKNPAYYWVPLIGLYTGMRLEEICQLHCVDISQENDVWYFNITTSVADNSTEIKLLKNKNAQRQVPIHNKLVQLGFIDFFEQIKEAGNERVFHELKKTDKCPKFGKNVGKAFSRYIKKCDIITDKKSFHSLRHTFSHYFKVQNLHNDLFRQVFGHRLTELAARQYGGKFSVQQSYDEIINKLDF